MNKLWTKHKQTPLTSVTIQVDKNHETFHLYYFFGSWVGVLDEIKLSYAWFGAELGNNLTNHKWLVDIIE